MRGRKEICREFEKSDDFQFRNAGKPIKRVHDEVTVRLN
jgi:hypothetical protein